MSGKGIYEVGEFRVDPDERLLLRAGKAIPLTPKAFETLLALVEHSGHVVKKDDLMKRVWPDTFVEEVNLAQNISVLRRALGGTADQYIETVPKLGYRLKVTARTVEASDAVPEIALQAETSSRLTTKRMAALATAAALGIAVLFVAWRFTGGTAAAATIQSLVVLPFANLSGDASQDYFVDGVTEALTTEVAKLSRVAPLRVISRTTAMRYKKTSQAVPEIAREIHVDAVLEGAVVRSGHHVRVTAQLIRAANDEHIWSQSYDRDLVDALAVQAEIARDIARHINAEIAAKSASRRTGPFSVEAQDAYLHGRYEWNKRGREPLLQARRWFQEALDAEPSYAAAWSGLADTEYLLVANNLQAAPGDGFPRARAAARRALELDDELAEAHVSLGMVTWAYDRKWPDAEAEYKRALELNPAYAPAHEFYGIGLASQSRFDQAIAEEKRAVELDPLSSIVTYNLARILYLARRYEDAASVCHKALQIEPSYFGYHQMLGLVSLAEGHNEQALTELERASTTLPDRSDFQVLFEIGRARARLGERDATARLLQDLRERAIKQYVPPHFFAILYAELGQMDTAFHWLDSAIEDERSPIIALINVSPEFDVLRSDPRFSRAVSRIVALQRP